MIYSNDLGSKNDWIQYDDFSSDLIHLDSEDYDYDSNDYSYSLSDNNSMQNIIVKKKPYR